MLSFNKDKIYANMHTFEKNVFFPGLIRKWKNIFCSEILMDSFRKIFAKYRIINLNMMQIGELNLKKKRNKYMHHFSNVNMLTTRVLKWWKKKRLLSRYTSLNS